MAKKVEELKFKPTLTEAEVVSALGLTNLDYEKGGIRGFTERWDIGEGLHLILYRDESLEILKMPSVDKRPVRFNRVDLFKEWDLMASSAGRRRV